MARVRASVPSSTRLFVLTGAARYRLEAHHAGLTKKRLHDREQERVRRVLSRFVPEHVVDDVLERTDNDLRLGGSRQVGTAMFTDIRGFTAFIEAPGRPRHRAAQRVLRRDD